MASTSTDESATLRRLTAQLIRSNHEPHIELAMHQARALDRYHRFRLVVRKSPAPADFDKPSHNCYGLCLSKGAILILTREAEDGGIGETFQVRLMHVFHFSRPDLTTEELAGEKALRAPFNLEYEDRQRPVEAIQALVPRLLGPLPPDLVDAMLPKPAVSGNRAEPLASHLFAAWLGGAPLPPLEAATSSSSSSSGAGAGAAAARGGSAATSSSSSSPSSFWMSGLIGLWNRVLGRKQPAGGAAAAAAAGEEEKEEEEEKKKKTKREEAEKPARPLMSTAEAWAMYEQRALQRGDAAVAENGSELERGWLPELLLQK